MATEKWKARVEAATVKITKAGGQGVLVRGGFVLTAAHCITWNGDGGMALGDHLIESITTKSGAEFNLSPWAAEPVSDIAVLGELDDQAFAGMGPAFDGSAYLEWREATAPVIVGDRPREGKPCAVHVLSHKGKWITGKVTRYGFNLPTGKAFIETDEQIQGGTSGGPVVDGAGRLIGVVSHASEGADCNGMIPVAHLALPGWAWARIGAPTKKGK